MKTLIFTTLLVICFVAQALAENTTCPCNFDNSTNHEYTCELSNEKSDHLSGKTDADVKTFNVTRNSEVKDLPKNICQCFINLEAIDIRSTDLNEISRAVFNNCASVKDVTIRNYKFYTFPEDVFHDLKNLTTLDVSNSELIYLPPKLFAQNRNLTSIKFNKNLLMVILAEFPKNVTQINFKFNSCIDEKVSGNFTVDNMKKMISENCAKNSTEIMTEKTAKLENKNKVLEEVSKKQETEKKSLESVNQSLLIGLGAILCIEVLSAVIASVTCYVKSRNV